MAVHWGYGARHGPETWVQDFPEAGGKFQSPVDIPTTNLKRLKPSQDLNWNYVVEHDTEMVNAGYTWKVHLHGEASKLYGGPLENEYKIEQFHCHWGTCDDHGSEHTVNGEKFAGELHFVHWNSTTHKSFEEATHFPDGHCVLGVLLKIGQKNEELDKIIKLLPEIQYKDQTIKIEEPLDIGLFLPQKGDYYTYQGSLTTPPCSENVKWIVFKEPIEVSSDQLEACRKLRSHSKEEQPDEDDEFEGFIRENCRPTEPLGERDINFVKGTKTLATTRVKIKLNKEFEGIIAENSQPTESLGERDINFVRGTKTLATNRVKIKFNKEIL